ncbi:hypothetical protein F4680DRAFT_470762 [Xylaria scruposa]|nr:hypothetical protein F4680DRAFT_470762 [Xylaria scruposa]
MARNDYDDVEALGSDEYRTPSCARLPTMCDPEAPAAKVPFHLLASSPTSDAARCSLDAETSSRSQILFESLHESPESVPDITTSCTSVGPQTCAPTGRKNHKFSKSLGLVNCYVVIGGTLLTFLALGFLTFLWVSREGTLENQSKNYLWRFFVLGGHLSQIITVVALVLRFSIATQTSICTSIVAALVLERRSIPLYRAAPLSVLRSVNAGPYILIKNLLDKNTWTFFLYPEMVLFLVLAFASVATQFSSTILLSDLQIRSVVGFPEHRLHYVTMTNNDLLAITTWNQPPREYSLFGEKSSDYSANPTSAGLSDTGLKRRAMLPFPKSNASSIRSYQGPAAVLNSRVACMPPSLSGAIERQYKSFNGRYWGYVSGHLRAEDTLNKAGLRSQGTCDSDKCLADIFFNCSIPVGSDSNIMTSYCEPSGVSPQFGSSSWKTDMDPWTPAAIPILVFSTNFDSNSLASLENDTSKLPLAEISGEWKSHTFGMGKMINITLCYNAFNIMFSNVSMSTTKDLAQPTIKYRGGDELPDADNILKFFGADSMVQDLNRRGIPILDQITDSENHVFGALSRDDLPENQGDLAWLEYAIWTFETNKTHGGCVTCDGDFIDSTREYAEVFLSIIGKTSRASIALQAVYTLLVQSLHAQRLDVLTVQKPIELVQTVLTAIPTRYTGFTVVVILVLIDTICILALIAFYLHYSRFTMIGDFWYAISQLSSGLTDSALNKGSSTCDRDISQLLGDDSYRPVRLMESGETGYTKISNIGPADNPSPIEKKPARGVRFMWAKIKDLERAMVGKRPSKNSEQPGKESSRVSIEIQRSPGQCRTVS